jgi:hypothetical protein
MLIYVKLVQIKVGYVRLEKVEKTVDHVRPTTRLLEKLEFR